MDAVQAAAGAGSTSPSAMLPLLAATAAWMRLCGVPGCEVAREIDSDANCPGLKPQLRGKAGDVVRREEMGEQLMQVAHSVLLNSFFCVHSSPPSCSVLPRMNPPPPT